MRVRPGEERIVVRMLGLMLVVWAGFAIGANGVESLFFARFGPRFLPYMFIALGLVTFPTTLAVTAILGRMDRGRVLAALPLALAVVVLGLRALLLVDERWIYPVLWLGMMVVWIVLGIGTWGLAGMVSDARQAKRLFPLYGAGIILGTALGGLATAPLATWIGAENLVLVWALSLLAAAPVARAIAGTRRRHRHPGLRGPRHAPPPLLREVREGAATVARSALLRRMAVAACLFGVLYFTLSLPFARGVTARFPDADRLAAFLGIFSGVTNAVALVVSLVLANRLFARFGVATMVATFPLIYLVGFGALAVREAFLVLVAFRLAQLVWMYGVWSTGWQALLGVVPPERRDQARAFLEGGPAQVGIVLAGVLLLLAERVLPSSGLFLAGVLLAGVALVVGVALRRAYRGAVLDALRGGWPEVFVPEDEPFGSGEWDAAAFAALREAAEDPDPTVRRIAVEISAAVPLVRARELCVRGLSDPDPGVRAAALRGVTREAGPNAAARLLDLLGDPDPEVRAEAADAATRCSLPDHDVIPRLRVAVQDDDARVRSRAAVSLVRAGDVANARGPLEALASSAEPEERELAVRALGEIGDRTGVVGALRDEEPSVRRRAAEALSRFGPDADEPLLASLGDPDGSVRDAAASGLGERGEAVVPRLLAALGDEARADGAILAISRCSTFDVDAVLRFARIQTQSALRYHAYAQAAPGGDDRLALLAYAARTKALALADRALRAQAALGDRAAVEMALEGLRSRDAAQRANALEMLEAAGDRELVAPLLPIYDPPGGAAPDGIGVVTALLGDEDPWLRACAALAAGAIGDAPVEIVRRLAETDPDPVVREAAARAATGNGRAKEDTGVETLSTLTVMERILALRMVPLFRELTPGDLKRVAEVAAEHLYPHGTVIAEHGDVGDAMHVVVTGDVRVLAGEDDAPLEEIARRGPGYIVGEMAVLSDEPRMASLVAEGEVRTLSIDRKRFQRILRERPDAALAVVRELSDRLRHAHDHAPADAPR